MSPQFVDFDADGKLDIVAGIFDGSPHLARGSDKGWLHPEQILDMNGERIVFNAFWNFDTKKWDTTDKFDAPGRLGGELHLTSAWAMDWDGDGDLDLLLGDHRQGYLFLRRNEGTNKAPKFGVVNEPVLANGKPLLVPGTVTTMRVLDWNRDGLADLLIGSMGDPWGSESGGGVFLYLDHGKPGAPVFGDPLVLVEPSKKGASEPTRPDAGLYMDAVDVDGDGDLDLVVGGYSQWQPPGPVLNATQQTRVAELRQQIDALTQKVVKLNEALETGDASASEEAKEKRRAEVMESQQSERTELDRTRAAAQQELDKLVPGPKRVSYVWLYENTSAKPARPHH